MTFEEETHQQQDEEQIQLQKQRENDQFQRELDEIITRLENEQFQKELNEIIARLENDSQEHEEEISSHESMSEERTEQQDIREKLSTTKFDNHEEEKTEEVQTQKQELAEIENSLQEEQDSVRNQINDLNLLQEQEEDPITKHHDQESQQSPPIEEEIASYQSATKEKSDTQNTYEQTTYTFEELSHLLDEILEEQQILSQELTKTKGSGREQEGEFDLRMREENTQIQQDIDGNIKQLDQPLLSAEKETPSQESVTERTLKPLEQSHQVSDDLSINKEKGIMNLDIRKTESLIHEDNKATRNQKLIEKNKPRQQDLDTTLEKSHQINQNSIKEKTELKIEKETYPKPLDDTITVQDVERKGEWIIKSGHEAIRTGKHSNLGELARKWNEHITRGERITVEMWEIYNKIQEKYDKPLVLYKENDNFNAYKMSICGEMYSQLDSKLFNKRLSNPAKQISKLLDYWLIQTGKKEGIKPFFEVTVKNPSTKEMETYWIPNSKQRLWNPYEAKDQLFFFGHRAAGGMITKFLTTKIKLNEKHAELYPKIEKSLRKKYPKLGVQTGRMNLKGQKVLFRILYKLNYPREVTEEAIKLMFWKYVDTHNHNYIKNFSRKISELLTYCNENNIEKRKDITKIRIYIPNSKRILVPNKKQEKVSTKGESRKNTKKFRTLINDKIDSTTFDNKTNINSRAVVFKLLTSLQRIETNFGLNGRSPTYKPPRNLIIEYNKRLEFKLIIKAESKSDKALSHFLLDGFGLSSRADTKRGAFWFGKIIYPTKRKTKNEWHRFTEFISSSCERKIENHDRWFSSKHAGGAKTVRRRIIVEIDLNVFNTLKAELFENARILANDSSHRRWVTQSRADARRNKNPIKALKRVEENIIWWNNLRSKLPIGSESYQKQALLFIMNTKKPAYECLARMLIEQKITNVELEKITYKIEEFSPVRKLIDSTTGQLLTLNEILQITDIYSISRRGAAFDVFNEHLGANIAFKAQLDFFNKYNPSQSPLVEYLGLDPKEVKDCNIETHWHDRNGYPTTGLSMADTFAPDIVVRDKMGNIIAVIQLKGYSQTRTSIQPNCSIFQLLELLKYENNPHIRTGLVNVNQEDDYIRYEWLVFEKIQLGQENKSMETISILRDQLIKNPTIDPLIPRNIRKRILMEDIYDKAIDCDSTYNITDEFNQIKAIILDSEKNFYRFIGQNERNKITEEIIDNYLIKLQDSLQKLTNQVGQPDGIDSYGQFRYHWARKVVLDYYRRIQECLKHS